MPMMIFYPCNVGILATFGWFWFFFPSFIPANNHHFWYQRSLWNSFVVPNISWNSFSAMKLPLRYTLISECESYQPKRRERDNISLLLMFDNTSWSSMIRMDKHSKANSFIETWQLSWQQRWLWFQYDDVLEMLESMERMNLLSLYRKYRPDLPLPGNARAW